MKQQVPDASLRKNVLGAIQKICHRPRGGGGLKKDLMGGHEGALVDFDECAKK